jgi:predicted aspartyl protease
MARNDGAPGLMIEFAGPEACLRKFALTFVATCAVFGSHAAEAVECKLQHLDGQVKMTPVKSGEGKIELVPVTVNGKPAKFRLDTAAKRTQISRGLAGKLQLPLASDVAAIGQLGFAQTREKDLHLPLLTGTSAQDGVLALDDLSRFDIDFDFSSDTLKLFSPDHCRGHVQYWDGPPAEMISMTPHSEKTGTFGLFVMIDNQQIEAAIDTSASSDMKESIAIESFGLKPGDADTPVSGQLGDAPSIKTYSHVFKTLQIGNMFFQDFRVRIVPDSARGRPDLGIGMNVLRDLHVYAAVKERSLYIAPAK